MFPATQPRIARRTRPSVDPGFMRPDDLPGLKLWLDAAALSDHSDGDPISVWRDISGSGNHVAQSTASKQPVYKASIIDGRPVVRFDGVDDILWRASAPLDNATSAFILAVIRTNTVPGTNRYIYSFSHADSNNGFDLGMTPTSLRAILKTDASGSTIAESSVGYGDGMPRILASSFDVALSSSQHKLVINGGISGQSNNTGSFITASHRINLGAFSEVFGAHFQGDVAEAVAYAPIPSELQLSRLYRYFSSKWGVTLV